MESLALQRSRSAGHPAVGRNETLRDASTLRRADQVYLKSGGSMKQLIVSLLTSDSFLYRKAEAPNG